MPISSRWPVPSQMAIQVVPHASEFTTAVDAFNSRMRAGGSTWGFYSDPEPDWIAERAGTKAWREYFLAVEDGCEARGAFALKPQQWWVNGSTEWITDYQGPFSEGAVDPKYASLALRLMRDMLRKRPLLFSAGHGGVDQPMVQLLRKLGWTLHGMPFCVYVVKPYRFLRLNVYLRKSRIQRLLLDLVAFSGLGSISVRLLHRVLHKPSHPAAGDVSAEAVDSFGLWADELWERNKDRYKCLAVRDREMMNTLLPPYGWPGGTRLRISRAGEVIGWSVVHSKRMSRDARFGDLSVGLITDVFGSPDDAAAIVLATHQHLCEKDVDIIVTNQSHPAWIAGLGSRGYVIRPGVRLFALSPELRARLEPFNETMRGLHLTNLDGHGPHGFTSE